MSRSALPLVAALPALLLACEPAPVDPPTVSHGDFWFGNLPGRRKAWIDFVGHLISLIPFTLIGIWVSVPQVATSWRLNEQSPDPSGLPRAPIKSMIIVAFVLLLIQAIAEVIKLVAVLRGYRTYEEVTTHEEPIRVE